MVREDARRPRSWSATPAVCGIANATALEADVRRGAVPNSRPPSSPPTSASAAAEIRDASLMLSLPLPTPGSRLQVRRMSALSALGCTTITNKPSRRTQRPSPGPGPGPVSRQAPSRPRAGLPRGQGRPRLRSLRARVSVHTRASTTPPTTDDAAPSRRAAQTRAHGRLPSTTQTRRSARRTTPSCRPSAARNESIASWKLPAALAATSPGPAADEPLVSSCPSPLSPPPRASGSPLPTPRDHADGQVAPPPPVRATLPYAFAERRTCGGRHRHSVSLVWRLGLHPRDRVNPARAATLRGLAGSARSPGTKGQGPRGSGPQARPRTEGEEAGAGGATYAR